jgi:hypothetical protein
MSTFPLHLIGYLKPNVPCGNVSKGFTASLGSSVKKMFTPVERLATITAIILVAALFISVFIKLGDAAALNAYYCNTCDIVPTLFVAPQ